MENAATIKEGMIRIDVPQMHTEIQYSVVHAGRQYYVEKVGPNVILLYCMEGPGPLRRIFDWLTRPRRLSEK